jgi:hypothetical protein
MASLIVAGDTSGSITISAPLVAGSGTLTLPTGTDTLVGKATTDTLTNKSIAATQLTGTIAAARLPAGSVLQVVSFSTSTTTSTTSVTYIDTAITLAITPNFSSSKILVTVHLTGCSKNTGAAAYLQAQLVRNASSLIEFEREGGFNNAANTNSFGGTGTSYLDSPATTSSTTYKVQIRTGSAAAVVINQSNATSTITLMEIAG